MKMGTVYLVGAGPGDIGLVTLRARELIQSCDVLVYDYLINPVLCDWCRSDCELICVGKSPGRHSIEQKEIEKILIDRAKKGKAVVRLKGGDPFVFGRGGEEACRLTQVGLDFEIVPGITAACAAAAYTAIPLTHREHSSSVCFLTGHEDTCKHAFHVDFRQFAKTGDTLCIYMGMGRLGRIVKELIAGGYGLSTPVAVVQWASLPQQRSLSATLGTVVEKVEEKKLGSPAIIIIGPVAHYGESVSWFEKRSLFGRRIVVTRSLDQADDLSHQLRSLGAEVLELPLIQTDPVNNSEDFDDIFQEIAVYEWVVFTSVNGVRYFFEIFFQRFKDIRCLGPMRIACVGPGTARAVEVHGLEVDLVPDRALAEALADRLIIDQSLDNTKVLVVCGNLNRDILVKKLTTEGRAIVDTMEVYKTKNTNLTKNSIAQDFREQGADAVIFTSASAVKSYVKQSDVLKLGPEALKPLTCSIGPLTSETMRQSGVAVDMEAKEHTLDGIVKALTKKFSNRKR